MSRRSARATASATASADHDNPASNTEKMDDSVSSAPKTTSRSGKRKASASESSRSPSARRTGKRKADPDPDSESVVAEAVAVGSNEKRKQDTVSTTAAAPSSVSGKRRPSQSPSKKRAKQSAASAPDDDTEHGESADSEMQGDTREDQTYSNTTMDAEPLFTIDVGFSPFDSCLTRTSSANANATSSTQAASSSGSHCSVPPQVCSQIMQYFSGASLVRFAATSRSAYSAVFTHSKQLRSIRIQEEQNQQQQQQQKVKGGATITTTTSSVYRGLCLRLKSLDSLKSVVSSSLRDVVSELGLYNSSGQELLATDASNTAIIAAKLPSIHALHLCVTTDRPRAVAFPPALRRLELQVRYKVPSVWQGEVRATKGPIWTAKQQIEWNEHLLLGIGDCRYLQQLHLWTSQSMRKQLAQSGSNEFLKPLKRLAHLDTLKYHLRPVTLSLDQYDIIRSLPSLTSLEDCGPIKLDVLVRTPLPRHFKLAEFRWDENYTIGSKELTSLLNISNTLTALTPVKWKMIPKMYDQLSQFKHLKSVAFGTRWFEYNPYGFASFPVQPVQAQAPELDREKLVATLEQMSKLEEVTLYIRDLDDVGLHRILMAVCASLRSLTVHSDSITSLESLTKISSLADRLTNLCISCPKVPREHVSHLLHLRSLQSLKIAGTFDQPLLASQLFHFAVNKPLGCGSTHLRQLRFFMPRGYNEVVPPEPAASAEERARQAAALEERYRAAPGALPLSSIERLPVTLLVLFISYMDLRSFVQTGRVSRSWRAAASAPGAWPLHGRKVKLPLKSTPPILQLQQFVNVTEIETLCRDYMDVDSRKGESHLELIMQLKRVRALRLNEEAWKMPSIFKCFQVIGSSLLQLTITGTPPSGLFASLPMLESLDCCIIASFACIDELAKLTNLTTFKLQFTAPNRWNGQGDNEFTQTHRLQWCSVLRTLSVEHSLRHLELPSFETPFMCELVSAMAGLKFKIRSDENWDKYQADLIAWRQTPLSLRFVSVPFPGFDWERVASPVPLLSFKLNYANSDSNYNPVLPVLCIPTLVNLHVDSQYVPINLAALRAFAVDHRMSADTHLPMLESLEMPLEAPATPRDLGMTLELHHFPTMTHLTLNSLHCVNMTGKYDKNLLGCLAELRTLRYLRLSRCKLDHVELASLRLPSSLEQLEMQDIQVDGVGDVQFSPATFAATLSPLTRLQLLLLTDVPLPFMFRAPPSVVKKSRGSKNQPIEPKQEHLEAKVDMDIDHGEVTEEAKPASAAASSSDVELPSSEVRCVLDILPLLPQLRVLRWSSHSKDIERMVELTQAKSTRPKKGGGVSDLVKLRRTQRELSRIREAMRQFMLQQAKQSTNSSDTASNSSSASSPTTRVARSSLNIEYMTVAKVWSGWQPLVAQADRRNAAAVAEAAEAEERFTNPRRSYEIYSARNISQEALAIVDEDEMRAEAEEEAQGPILKKLAKAAAEARKDAPVKKRRKKIA